MAAKQVSYPFTDYRRTDGGAEQHNVTAGELTLDARWTLHFKGRLKKHTRYGGITRYELQASQLATGGCRVGVRDKQTGERFCEFTLPKTDAETFAADFIRLRQNIVAAKATVTKREADGTWWTAPNAFKGLGWTGSLNINGCAYMGGYSSHPKTHGNTNILAVGANGLAYRGLKEIFRIPWSQVADLTVDGPEQASNRITATRLLTMGVFAVAAKKTSKSAVLIIDLHSGEQAVFHTEKLTAPELKAKLAPITSQIHVAAKRKAELTAANTAPVASSPDSAPAGFSVADELMKLKQLCDQGILTEEQFAAQRDKLLNA